jgi:hypothetical protein
MGVQPIVFALDDISLLETADGALAGKLVLVIPQARSSRKAIGCKGFGEELPYQGECSGTPSKLQQQYSTMNHQQQAFEKGGYCNHRHLAGDLIWGTLDAGDTT